MAEDNPSTPVESKDFDVRLTELHSAAKAYAQATEAYVRAADDLAQAAFEAYGDPEALLSFRPPCVCVCIIRSPQEPAGRTSAAPDADPSQAAQE